jgi:hypothetical protein
MEQARTLQRDSPKASFSRRGHAAEHAEGSRGSL